MLRGNAAAITVAVLGVALMTMAVIGFSESKEDHAPIHITGDQEMHANLCQCIENPGAPGTKAEPYIISDWRITSGHDPGIVVRDIDNTYFEIRRNSIETPTGIKLINTGDRGDIIGNSINYDDYGITLKNSAPLVSSNIVQAQGYLESPPGLSAVRVDGSAPTIRGNQLSDAKKGIHGMSASPTIQDNTIVENRKGIVLEKAADADLSGNVIKLSTQWGLVVRDSARADLTGNQIRGGSGGIIADSAQSLYLANNTVTNMDDEAVRFTDTDVTMFRNTVSDNWRGAVGSSTSDLLIQGNHFKNNGDDAIVLDDTRGTVQNNLLERNEGTAIVVEHSILTLKDNELYNNTFGFSIPHDSRQTVELMEGNVVNGVNVDGTDNPAEKRFFYKEAGVRLSDGVVDSGHGDGYYGVHSEQGAVVVYDSRDIVIENVTFEYQITPDPSDGEGTAIYVRESFNTRIRNNTFSNNHQAVVSVDAKVFIKENICEIDIDPEETICIEARGGFASVRANVIAHVAVGVRLKASAEGEVRGVVEGNTIRKTTTVGVELHGGAFQETHDIEVLFNDLEANAVGMALVEFQGYLKGNVVGNSTGPGVELHSNSNATFEINVIVDNEAGIVDEDPCRGQFNNGCSGGVFVENRIRANAGVGVFVGGGGLFEGDVVTENEVGIEVDGEAALHNVTLRSNSKVGLEANGQVRLEDGRVQANGQIGARVDGVLRAQDVNVSHNDGDGLQVDGEARLEGVLARNNSEDGAQVMGRASVTATNASHNGEAGFRFAGSTFVVTECEASFNADGVVMADVLVNVEPDVRIEIEPPEQPDPDRPGDGDDRDPLFMHDCNVVANSDYAVRATTTTVVNATLNFWGDKDGPKYDLPFIRKSNVVSDNVIASPYWESRAHMRASFVPQTEAGAAAGADPGT